jgi:hypothetical protein
MHHRPPGFLLTCLRAAMARSTAHLSRRRGALLAMAVALAVTAGTALAGQPAGTAPSAVAALDAAASRSLPAGNAQDGTPAAPGASSTSAADAATEQRAAEQPGTRHRGDHQREAAQPDAAPTPNPNCTLVVPRDPTGAAGLATPYELVATDRAAGPCHEAVADQSAFVEAAIFDPATHALSIYHPLVVDRHDRPAVPPVPVALPAGAVVGVWFGFNGDTLTLTGPGASACVNGLPGSPFGQFAYCNAAALFSAATADPTFQASIPQLGTSPMDALPCPTSRDFSVVDQDQSDNLATVYRVIDGRMAQVTPTTADRGTKLTNGSDEGLVARFIAPALGCRPFTAPDLTDGGAPTPALALNELFAAARQGSPVALVPTSDPMAQVDGTPSVGKTDLYRAGVGQPPLPAGQTPQEYCARILALAPARLTTDAAFLAAAAAPTPDSPNLLTFLRDRLANTLQELGCQGGGTGEDPGDTGTAPATTGATSTAPASPMAGSASPTTGSAAATTGSAAGTAADRTAPATTRPHTPRPGRPTAAPTPTSAETAAADPTTAHPTATSTADQQRADSAAAGAGD